MDYIQIIQWTIALFVALYVLVKGADYFIEGAKELGIYFGLGSFTVGVLIVGVGTSLPELASSIAAVLADSTEIVVANAVGSNITNILLIVGTMAVIGGPILIHQNLLKSELPIFFIATVHFIAIIHDGNVDQIEALLLVGTFCAYIWYLLSSNAKELHDSPVEVVDKKITAKTIGYILGGITALLIGAHYTVEMAVLIATELTIPIGLISIAAIAIGTSLPELFVSIKAIKNNETELAIGNIFGSNAFNILTVVGVSGLISPLVVDEVVMGLGLWILVAASLILLINGLARQVQRWEGVAMLLFFSFFLIKLIDFI